MNVKDLIRLLCLFNTAHDDGSTRRTIKHPLHMPYSLMECGLVWGDRVIHMGTQQQLYGCSLRDQVQAEVGVSQLVCQGEMSKVALQHGYMNSLDDVRG